MDVDKCAHIRLENMWEKLGLIIKTPDVLA